MITSIIEIFMYIYIILKLHRNYSNERLVEFLSFTSYYIFNFYVSMYVALTGMLIIHNKYIPIATSLLYSKMKDTRIISSVNKAIVSYNVIKLCDWLIIIGDMCNEICATIIVSLSGKIQNDTTGHSEQHNNSIDDFMTMNEEEELDRINTQLDNLLKLGSDIITSTTGKRTENVTNTKFFMKSVDTLLRKK